MAIDSATTQRIVQRLRVAWGDRGCPLCGGNEWTVAGYVNLACADSPSAIQLTGKVLPGVGAICRTCGFTAIVNLVAAGIVQADPGGNA